MTTLSIRPATAGDAEAVWAIIERVIRAGEVFALPRDMQRDDAVAYWMTGDHIPFVAEENDTIVGTYYIRANRMGGGGHVANAGYATAGSASGKGVARAMCAHSLDEARARDFRAMQYNFVVSSNFRAVWLWKNMGFEEVGRFPVAFEHPALGYVDALVMWREL